MKSFFTTLIITAILLTGCKTEPKFTVEGNITHASGKILYLEMRDIDKNILLDSCKLDEKGKFKFKQTAPEYPQFYALKLNNQSIFFSIDSTEVLTINSDSANYALGYEVKGSENAEKIKELCLLQHNTQQKVNEALKSKEPKDSIKQQISTLLSVYKDSAIKYILAGQNSVKSSVAYFALFQRINDYLIFDPYDKKDNKIFSAVATGYDIAYPKSPRSIHLKNLTLQAISAIRPVREKKEIAAEYSKNIEIALPNEKEEIVTLSSTEGKVVILDFTAYRTEFSPAHNLDLREVYNKYASKGLEIYQISLDTDENFWKVSASNLPWICVWDKDALRSQVASKYNVTELPTYYLLDKNGELVKRNSQVKNLDEEINRLLK